MNKSSTTPFSISPSGQSCGATINGLDLREPLSNDLLEALHAAWLEHHVLVFPGQRLSPSDLERFTERLGAFGPEPFVTPLEEHPGIVPIQRLASETGPLFAGTWHTDWSFLPSPPIGTCLYGLTIPPSGGDTLFANQHAALEAMPDALRQKLEGKTALHSARHAYGPAGTYAQMDSANRGMIIATGSEANTQTPHRLIRPHSATGRLAIYGTAGHITGIEGLDEAESKALLGELYRWQTRPEFQYRHKWQQGMLVMWDNRSVIHMATGGYKGHTRLLYRTMIGAPEQASA